MAERIACVVVGAGQAGLATSRGLSRTGVDHVVLERGRLGQSWRGRWESFCLVTPNWGIQLPDASYEGDDPDGFLVRDDIVAWLEDYANGIDAPVRDGVEVNTLHQRSGGGFDLDSSAGRIEAETVVVATGAYQRAHRPAAAAALPTDLLQIDVESYHNPAGLPDGPVLVVGSGQSGAQIAEELHQAGRSVFLACGRAPWLPRRIGDHDLFRWALDTGFLDQPVAALPAPAARLAANLLASGRDGGHDLTLRTLQAMGVKLLGHLTGAEGLHAVFAPDLGESLAWGDERYQQFMGLVEKLVTERDLPRPQVPDPGPFDPTAPEQLDLSGFGAVIFAGGYRPDYASWVDIPGAFDELGFPVTDEGASTVAPGLAFAGVHFLRKRKSSLLVGVGEDATLVAQGIASRL